MLVWLDDVRKTDVATVGGKGASLGEMCSAGIPLPRGFCLTANAYRLFIEEGGLTGTLSQALDAPGVRAGEPLACEAASSHIRARLDVSPIPSRLADVVRAAYAQLGETAKVAVRSSATAEDLPDASFAGQQETFLNVLGIEQVLLHVRRCWSSLWTARAISYRARQGYDHLSVALAVVVQHLIEADVAGVLFTINPVTNNRDELLVNASYGLGEAVVSGLVTPDTFTLDRQAHARKGIPLVKNTLIGTKAVCIRSLPEGGTVTQDVLPADRARSCLADAELRALLELGIRVEAHYGCPQDIEWAFQAGKLHLLQARPVTTVGDAPMPPLSRTMKGVVDDLLEHYPDAPWPLDHAAVVEGYEQLQHAMREVGVNPKPADQLMVLNEEGVCRIMPSMPRPRLKLLALPLVLWQNLRAPSGRWKGWLDAEPKARAQRLEGQGLAGLDGAGLVSSLRERLDLAAMIARYRFSKVVTPMMMRSAYLGLLARLAGKQVVAFEWLAGLSYRTVQVEADLQGVADLALGLPEVRVILSSGDGRQLREGLLACAAAAPVLKALDAFLERHGARTQKVYLPFSNRSWREEPDALLVTLSALVRAGDVGGAAQRAQAGKARFDALLQDVRQRLPWGLRSWLARSLERTVAAFREDHQGREETLYRIEEAFWLARQAVDEAARRLVQAGVLERPDQVKLLTLPELSGALKGEREVTELRRLISRREARRGAAVSAWRAQKEITAVSIEGGLAGVAGAPGVAEGRVRIVMGLEDFGRLERGEVLVCPFTDPTWTPLFSLASAVVADTGGPLSHAAIVAREYGIPAVLGTQTGTTLLREGERVRVHGGQGRVERLDETIA